MYARKPPTFGDDRVISRLKWLLMPQNGGAVENHEDLHHRIEVCIRDTVAENQITEWLGKVVKIVEVDVASC